MANEYGMNYGTQVGRKVTQAFGGRWTPEKQRFFDAWARAEGTKAAYNPFATTRAGFPSTQFNSVGVKNYRDLETGVAATIDTLSLDYYTQIVKLLRSDNVTAKQLAEAVAASPWGTGTGVLRVLGVTQSDGYDRATSTAQYGAKKGAIEQQYQKITLDRFRPSEGYLNALERIGGPAEAALRLAKGFQPFTVTQPMPADQMGDAGPATYPSPAMLKNGFLQLPTKWKSTHPTSGLENEGFTSAIDLMGAPGTVLGAPESGTVRYFHPEGAQGGGSMMFVTDSGREYWLGHIANGVAAGTRVERGGRLAVISPDHPRPHVHVDVRTVRRQKGKK